MLAVIFGSGVLTALPYHLLLQAVIDDCARLAGSRESSNSLLGAQTQLRLHSTLEEECVTAQSQCAALAGSASTLLAGSHERSEEIAERQAQLEAAVEALLHTATKRREDLEFQERVMLYNVRVDHLKDVVLQKDTIVRGTESGEDGFAVDGLLQELDLFEHTLKVGVHFRIFLHHC
jgi:hypothetical protein